MMVAAVADAVLDAIDELLEFVPAHRRKELDEHLLALKPRPKGRPVPEGWRSRVRTLFPRFASKPFATRHEEYWGWVEEIEAESSPDPFCGFWSRGGAKSSSVEMGVTDLGVRGKRFYCLYVCGTQEQADKHVGALGTMFESPEIAAHYPEHGERAVGKYGNSKGWRRTQLRTAGGFTIDAIGLDVAARGFRIDEHRPDLIVFDDVDELHDSPATTKKKRDTITHSILPAGSSNVAVIFIQNLIISDGIAAQLADGRADFLVKRIISGPYPAIDNLTYEWQVYEKTGVKRAVITGGTPTWEGQDLAVCQKNMDDWSLSAFLKEGQHEVFGKAEGVALDFTDAHYVDMTDDQAKQAVALGRCFGGVDFGAWRFGFTLWCADRHGVVTRIDEVFAQRLAGQRALGQRARMIHECCMFYGIEGFIPIWGDAANPQDITEINLAFRTGWEVEYEDGTKGWEKSKLRVIAVLAENKARKVAVSRINNALATNTLRFRREPAYEWRYNMNASNPEGTEMTGSRLMWEIGQWSFPIPKEGEAQDQNPDDDTADGADMVASMRYALMSHWRGTKVPKDYGEVDDDTAERFDYKSRKFIPTRHAVDDLPSPSQYRRAPRITVPRIRK